MADERAGTREFDARKNLCWTELLRTFLIALDPFKLLVAAAGVLATAVGWWLLSLIYFNLWTEAKLETSPADEVTRYNKMRDLAGPGGYYRTMPWFEDRGRNPYILTRDAITPGAGQRTEVLKWFVTRQVFVVIEPLLKFLRPIVGLVDSNANFWMRLYLFFITLWMLAMWGFFGGIITRMAIVQIAGKEGGGLRDALRFVKSRYLAYFSSPVVPILLIFAVVAGLILFGFFHMIPMFGDIVVDGLFWWVPLGAGFVMALLVVGLVGYPLMYSTLSAEGSDTFDALSRSYNYVYESPWNYIWYSFVAVVYGGVVVFFVIFMSSLMVDLGKWGVKQTPWTQAVNRSPEYLFIYAPTSFGWQELLLEGSPAALKPNPNYRQPAEDGTVDMHEYVRVDQAAYDKYMESYHWYEHAGAGMVAFWITLVFMLMLGFSYSYFWTASSMIYLLMRKKVDEVEVDEIYTEEEDIEEPVAPPKLSTPPPAAPTSIPIEAPTLRVTPPPPPPSPPAPAASGETPPAPPPDAPPAGAP